MAQKNHDQRWKTRPRLRFCDNFACNFKDVGVRAVAANPLASEAKFG